MSKRVVAVDPFADAKPRLSTLMNQKRFLSTGAPTDVSPWSFGAGTRSDTFVLSPFRGDGAEWAQG